MQLSALKEYTKNIAEVDTEAKYRHEVTKQIGRGLVSVQRSDDITELSDQYEAGCAQAIRNSTSRRFDNVSELKQIDQLIKAIQNADESGDEIQEDITTAAPQTQRCPILGGTMMNPVRNVECDHVYSLKGAISILFQRNAPSSRQIPESLDRVPAHFRTSCPMAGCGKQFSAGTLKRDYATELTQRQAQQSASMGRQSMEVEELM